MTHNIMKKAGCVFHSGLFTNNLCFFECSLCFADLEHLGATSRADTLGRGLAVLHGDRLGALHFFLGAAFHTITLHRYTSYIFCIQD